MILNLTKSLKGARRMITIQNLDHLWALETPACSEALRRFLSELLQALEDEVAYDEREAHLLQNPIILCERGDNLLDMIDASPFGHEYVEEIDLNGVTVYRVGVLLDNDSFVQYLVPTDGLDAKTKAWLNENADIGGDRR